MARKKNDNRLSTPVMIEKTVKSLLDTLRNKDVKRQGNESDNNVIKRIITKYISEHLDEVHDPKSTYVSKT